MITAAVGGGLLVKWQTSRPAADAPPVAAAAPCACPASTGCRPG